MCRNLDNSLAILGLGGENLGYLLQLLEGTCINCSGHINGETVILLHLLPDLFRASLGHNLAVVKDKYTVADCLDLLQNMGGKNYCLFLSYIADKLTDFDNLVRVKACCWLVQDKDIGRMEYSLCKTSPLPITFGKLADATVNYRTEACLLDYPVNLLFFLIFRHLADIGHEIQVFNYSKVIIERSILGQIPG